MTIADELAEIAAVPLPLPGKTPAVRRGNSGFIARGRKFGQEARLRQGAAQAAEDRLAIADFATLPGSAVVSTKVVRAVLGYGKGVDASRIADRTGMKLVGGGKQGQRWTWRVADVRDAMGRMEG